MPSVFISYRQKYKDNVATLPDMLEERGISYFWDDKLSVGLWEEELRKQLSGADAMIVILTEDVADPKQESYVRKEIQMAVELDYTKILPIQVGDFDLGDLSPLLGDFHQMRVPSLDALFQKPLRNQLLTHLDEIKTYVEQGGRKSNQASQSAASATTLTGWPAEGDHLLERQSLALAVAMLEGDLPFFIVDAAREIQTRMVASFRPETKKERNAAPRGFSKPSQAELLASIGAERVSLKRSDGARQDALRFKDPNRRQALLTHIWNDRSDVRAFMLSWLQELFESESGHIVAQRIGGGLSYLARIDLASVRYELLSIWLKPEFQFAQLQTASKMLAIAYSRPSNRPMVREILVNLAKGLQLHDDLRPVAEEAALIVVLGDLGQWAPDLAVDILKVLAPAFRRGHTWNDRMLLRLWNSSFIFAEKIDSEKDGEETVDSLASDAKIETDAAAKEEPTDAASTVGGSMSGEKGTSLPIADFLDAISGWIDVKVSRSMPKSKQQQMLLDRQVALYIFLTVFERMPLYAISAPDRLTLEELHSDIGARQKSFLDAIKAAFARAAIAEKQPGSAYLPRKHLQQVMRLFAIERKNRPNTVSIENDPFLNLARDIAGAAEAKKDGYGAYVTRTCGRFLTQQEIEFVQSGATPQSHR